jgi:opacity protein-like surface antigen
VNGRTNVFTRYIASTLFVTLLATAGAASAQNAPQDQPVPPIQGRANRGLFGGDEPMPGLSMLLTGGSGYDTNVLAGQQGGGGFPLREGQISGNFAEGSGALTFLHVRNRTVLSLVGLSNGRYYPDLDTPASFSHTGSMQLEFTAGRRWAFQGRQAVQYASFNRFVYIPLGPGVAGIDLPANPTPDPAGTDIGAALDAASGAMDTGVASRRNLSYESEFSAIQTLTSRDSISYYATRHRTDTGFERRHLVVQMAGSTYRRQMTRYGGLRAGYGYSVADYHRVPPDILRMHLIDTGFDYSRPLSFSRRTTVGSSTGVQMFDRRGTMIYRALLAGTIAHEIGRTWEIGGQYDRGAQYAVIVDEPVYADTVRVHSAGLIGGRRLMLSIDGSYSSGHLTYTLNQNQIVTYTAAARLQWAISQNWSFDGMYSYYDYEFGSDVALPTGILPRIDRQSVRFGISYWLPLSIQRGNRGPR